MISPPDIDLRAGLLVYGSQGPRYQVKLRERNEDFQVEEIIDLGDIRSEPCEGCVPVYRVEKRGIDTPHMARVMSERLKSNVNFGGLKDKKAYAIQYLSARSARAESPHLVEHQLFRAERVGFSPRPIAKRSIAGNRFKLVLRSVQQDIITSIEDAFARCRERAIPNFYGYQRFGLRGMVTHRVGREIVKRNFQEAVRILVCDPREGEGPSVREARELSNMGRYEEALTLFTESQDIERKVLQRMVQRKDDFLGGLRSVPIQVRRLFVHAYQSYLFNLTLSRAVASATEIGRARNGDNWSAVDARQLNAEGVHGAREPVVDGSIPLVQLVGYSFRDYGSRFDLITRDVLKEERVEPKLFYIKEAEEMSSEGGFRHAPLLATNLQCRLDGDSAALDFSLGRGEYATSLLREITKPEDPFSAGF
jgi:tRNA pseudouridine13 synthase